mgnify:CR=1
MVGISWMAFGIIQMQKEEHIPEKERLMVQHTGSQMMVFG